MLFLFWFAVGAFVGMMLGFAISSKAVEAAEKKALQARQDADRVRASTDLWHRSHEEAMARTRHVLKLKEEDLDRQREEAESELQAARAALQHAQSGLTVGPEGAAASDERALTAWMRQQHLRGQWLGPRLTVAYAIDPSLSGLVCFRWEVFEDGLPPAEVAAAHVCVVRDGEMFRIDHGLTGEHSDVLTPGERYQFTFCVYGTQARALGAPLRGEVIVPDAHMWRNLEDSDEKARAEQERKVRAAFKAEMGNIALVQELTEAAYREVKARGLPEHLERWVLSKVDALRARLLGEED